MLPTLPYSRRAVDCRYGMCQAGTREYFRPGCKRPYGAFEKEERGRRARDTTIGIRRVRGIVLTVYLALILVAPSELTLKIRTVILVVRAITCIVHAVADRACSSMSLCVIVVRLGKVRVKTATRSNERIPTMIRDCFFSWQLRQSALFSHRASARG